LNAARPFLAADRHDQRERFNCGDDRQQLLHFRFVGIERCLGVVDH
jgi:hypothetical protein